jgi:hypothetical protein
MIMGEMDEDIHLAMHREADELGKFATQLEVHSPTAVSREQAAKFLDELLVQVTKGCMEHGADLVGHVKAFLKAPNGAMSASLIDLSKRSNVTHDFGAEEKFQDAELTLHVIVHGLWDPEVREQSLIAMDQVFKQFGLTYRVIKDYYEVEKGISHHKT